MLFVHITTGRAVCHWLLDTTGAPFLANSGTDPQPLSPSAKLGTKPPTGSRGGHLEVVDVVFGVQVNALGLFVDGHDGQSDVDGAMQLPLGDLGRGSGESEGKGLFLDPWAQRHHVPAAT